MKRFIHIPALEFLIIFVLGFVSCALGKNGGHVITLAGSVEHYGDINGAVTKALFHCPESIAVDTYGNLYVADTCNQMIRKIDSGGLVTTLAGSGTIGFLDGMGVLASFNNPSGIAVDSLGNVYVADTSNQVIRKIRPDGAVTTLAGSVGVKGFTNGIGAKATFNYPKGVALDSSGNVYVADQFNNSIRKITPEGIVTTFAGSGTKGCTDGAKNFASFYFPEGIAIDTNGNVYIADDDNHCIRKIDSQGLVSTLGGAKRKMSLSSVVSYFGIPGFENGPVTSSMFFGPRGIAVDTFGNVYVADTGNQLVRVIAADGNVATLAGSKGVGGAVNGIGTKALFQTPSGIAVDSSGSVYVADSGNNIIRKIK